MQAVRDEIQADSPQSSDTNNIQHIVSKRDTLAGLAIKYGVEVTQAANPLVFISSYFFLNYYVFYFWKEKCIFDILGGWYQESKWSGYGPTDVCAQNCEDPDAREASAISGSREFFFT